MKLTVIAAVLVVGACVARPVPATSTAVYSAPAEYVGRTVRVCGYLYTPWNLYETYPRDSDMVPVGLSVIDRHGIIRRETTDPLCLTGKIIRTGCTVELICIRHNFEYGIVPRRMEPGSSSP